MTFLERLNKRIPFWPIILLYLAAIAFFSSSQLNGDEFRYLKYADRLLQGNYAGDPQNPDMINGPGWPLIVAFYRLLRIPVYWMHFFNAFLLWGAVVFVNKSIKIFTGEKTALLFTLLFAFYPPFLVKSLPYVKSEVFAIFLISSFAYYFIRIVFNGEGNRKNFFWASFLLGMLILTRVQFSYIAVVGAMFGVIYWIFSRDKKGVQTSLVLILSLVVCLPYLGYTYNLTGKFFYWGTNGGEQLYWMSAGYEGQWGNWVSPKHVKERADEFPPEQVEFIREIEALTFVETNERYLEEGVKNIKENPQAYMKNYIANLGRMMFNFPYTYEPQKLDTYFFIFSNIFFLFCLFMSFIPLFFHWKKVPYALVALALFSLMYLGGTSLMAAVNRYVVLTLPFVSIWLAYVAEHFVVIKIKTDEHTD